MANLAIRWLRAGCLGLLCAGLWGCAGDAPPKPSPLPAVSASAAARLVWRQQLAPGPLPLSVVALSDRVVVADNDGAVMAIDLQSGTTLWRGDVKSQISAGVGSDGRHAAVVTDDNELVVLEQGEVKWRQELRVRVYTSPLVVAGRVFVSAADRSVQAFDLTDGNKLWKVQQPSNPLTLAYPGVLLPYKNTLIVGQGARMVGLEPSQGSVAWDVPVGAPRGANEIERLADLVGPAARVGDTICVRAYQAAVSCVNAQTAAVLWTKAVGGLTGLAADTEWVWGADASSRMTAWRAGSGQVAWTSDSLRYRGLTAPLLWGDAVVWGDAQGVLHGVARETGQPLWRLLTDGSAVTAPPVRVGATMLVVTRKGGLFAFRAD